MNSPRNGDAVCCVLLSHIDCRFGRTVASNRRVRSRCHSARRARRCAMGCSRPSNESMIDCRRAGSCLVGAPATNRPCAPSIGSASATAATTPFARPWRTPPGRRRTASASIALIHDAPGCDFDADEILSRRARRQAVRSRLRARRDSTERPSRCSDRAVAANRRPIGVGKAKVDEVASNRRVPGPDGKVKYVRYSATKDPKIRAEPEGLSIPTCRRSHSSRGNAGRRSHLLRDASAKLLRQGRRELRFPGHCATDFAIAPSRHRCTSTSTALAATSPPANTTTARPPTEWSSPNGSPTG